MALCSPTDVICEIVLLTFFFTTQILEEEINPTMNKLKEERSTYLEYQKVEREYEHLSKFCIAFKFVTAQVCPGLDQRLNTSDS